VARPLISGRAVFRQKPLLFHKKTRPNPVAPKSANEDSFFLCGRARARIVVMVKQEDPS
jgi:hypothetical protein